MRGGRKQTQVPDSSQQESSQAVSVPHQQDGNHFHAAFNPYTSMFVSVPFPGVGHAPIQAVHEDPSTMYQNQGHRPYLVPSMNVLNSPHFSSFIAPPISVVHMPVMQHRQFSHQSNQAFSVSVTPMGAVPLPISRDTSLEESSFTPNNNQPKTSSTLGNIPLHLMGQLSVPTMSSSLTPIDTPRTSAQASPKKRTRVSTSVERRQYPEAQAHHYMPQQHMTPHFMYGYQPVPGYMLMVPQGIGASQGSPPVSPWMQDSLPGVCNIQASGAGALITPAEGAKSHGENVDETNKRTMNGDEGGLDLLIQAFDDTH
ncbi:hypothetical protein BC830DRAFT_1171089 [Chytriomyces sp. MP71]|nr:hypothetical protein BC830DRAFT_1171089 [Chytriomyces sp. MP71]